MQLYWCVPHPYDDPFICVVIRKIEGKPKLTKIAKKHYVNGVVTRLLSSETVLTDTLYPANLPVTMEVYP